MSDASKLAEALKRATREIRDGFKDLVEETAVGLGNDIKEGYRSVPRRSGNLVAFGVSIKRDPTGLQTDVRARAPHAHLVEFGTAARQTQTGANRGRVRVIHPVTIPAAQRRLPKFMEQARKLLQRELDEVKS